METILNQIRSIASTADNTAREKLKLALRDLQYTLEDDDDVVRRVGYYPLETACVRIAIRLKLFELLVKENVPMKVEDVARQVKADPSLMERIIRYLAATGYVTETDLNTYRANSLTKKLTVPGVTAGICHMWETCGPQFLEMPKYLLKTNYAEPHDYYHTVSQDAFDTKEGAFEWFQHNPENLEHFNNFMAMRRGITDTWLSIYPVEAETAGWPETEAVFVNMGGSIGHQCAEFKAKFPNIPGRVILQDLPHTIAVAMQTPGVENMVHDFFTPQPIKGAKYYFLRGVLHDHPDERVEVVLGHIRDAMGDKSILLIDDMVMPDVGANANASGIDLAMMCASASRERTKSQWDKVIHAAGLKVVQETVYKPSMYETLMRVVKV